MTGLLLRAWQAVGGDPTLLDRVRTTGDARGLLPSRLPALDAVTAATACATLAASVLDATRQGGEPGAVRLDRRHVAVASRSERYAQRVAATEPPRDLFAPLSRFWRTADGWVRLHGNYPWHRDRALGVLGLDSDGDPGAVASAIAGRHGSDLEAALAAVGGVGAAVRTPGEWAAHAAGAAAAVRPLVRWSTPDPRSPSVPRQPPGGRRGRAANGIRVLDLTRVIAGPVATRTLAAWGADVLRLDPPHLPELPGQTVDTLVGKHSAVLDARARAGRAVLDDLLGQADVMVHGYRPGSLDALGLSSAELVGRHPHLAVVSVSAWGEDGPWADRRGFDSVVQAACGIAVVEGSTASPGVLPAQVLDHATGYLAAAAAMLAVAATIRGEPPGHASLALAATAGWLMGGDPVDRRDVDRSDRALDVTDRLADAHRVTVPGTPAVSVISPPGRVAGLPEPAWQRSAALGGDPPAFQPR